MYLKRLLSAITRDERNGINENWEKIERGFSQTASDLNAAHDKADSAKRAAENAVNTANSAKTTAEYVQSQLDNVVADGDSLAEVVQARGEFVNLRDRLDSEFGQVTEQLTQTGEQIEAVNTQLTDHSKAIALLKYRSFANARGYRTINLLGDSISHGANAPDIANDAWTGIMRKFLQVEFDALNHGFISVYDRMENAKGVYQDAHTITRSGAWSVNNNNAVMGLYTATSSVIGDKLTVTMRKPAKFVQVWHTGGGGVFNVMQNGVQTATITCSGAAGTIGLSSAFSVTALSYPFTFELVKADNTPTSISGIQYMYNNDDFVLNNFARSGAQLGQIANSVIDEAVDTNVLFLALGHNDEQVDNYADFKNKLDYIKTKVLSNGAYVVVCDFIWRREIETDRFKQALKAFSDAVPNSIYVNFSDHWGTDVTKLQTRGVLSDGSHPSVRGHMLIAEKIAKEIGLGISSKTLVERVQMLPAQWILADLQNNWADKSTNMLYRTKFKKEGDTVTIQFFLSQINGAENDTVAFVLPVGYRPSIQTYYVLYDDATNNCRVRIRSNGEVILAQTGTTNNFDGFIKFDVM